MKSSSGASTFALAAGLIVFNFAATVLVFLVAMPLLIPAGNVSPAGYAAIQRGTAILVFAAGTVFSFLLAFGVRRLARRGVSPAAMIDAVRQPCFILNPDNTYSLINREAGRLLGLSHERDAGKPVDPGVQAALAAGAAAGDAEAGRGMNRNCVVTLGGARYLALDNPFSATDSDSAGQRQGRLVVLRNVEAELRIRDCFKEIVAAMVVLGDDTRNIVESSTRLTQSAMSQDSSIAAITSSLDEFSKKIQGNTESAAKGTQFAAQAREVAERSGGEIAHALSAMNEVQDVGVRIARIVKLIDDIAFQTNLLALNASVEAARAGRQGKGFAVVAEEVRNLAGRSARAAKDTASMVEDVTERIGNASSYMSRLEEMLRNIVQEAVRMADYSASAAATSTEQASAILQVNQELGQINSMTRSTCSAAEDTSSHVGNLENKVGELRHLLERFAIDMGGVVRPGPQSHFPSRKSGGSALHDDFAAGRYAPSFAPPFTPPSFGASPADDDFVEPFKKMAAEKWNLRADAGNGSPLPDLLRTDGYDREYNAFLRTGAPESTASHTPLSHFVKQTGENGSGGGNAYSNLADGPAEYKTNRDGDKIVRPEQKIHLDDAEFGRY